MIVPGDFKRKFPSLSVTSVGVCQQFSLVVSPCLS